MTPDDAPAEAVCQQPTPPAPLVRRRFGRVNVDVSAKYTIGTLPDWADCSIVDIGGGGVRLQTLQRIPVGKSIAIRFVFERVPVEAKARVVDLAYDPSNGGYFASAAFASIDPKQQQHIEERVTELRAAGQT